MKKYADISKMRLQQTRLTDTKQKVIVSDSRNLLQIWKENNLPKVDFCITSPPYWNQLKRSYIRQKGRAEKGLDTKYGEKEGDIGNIDDYEQFLKEQKLIFDKVYEVMRNGGYLVIITNNVYADGQLYPLAFDTVKSLSDK